MTENRKALVVWLAVLPTMLICVLVLAALLFRTVLSDAAWIQPLAWVAAVAAALNPGLLLLLIPIWKGLAKKGYIVREAVTADGVGRDTLDRCAAVAEANANHPIAACLRAYCGDIGAPPDKFVEMPGLGVSVQFSNQMIHAGSAEYMRGLKIAVPDVEGTVAHIALENRAVGYYRFQTPSDVRTMRSWILRGVAICAAFKIALWVTLALTGTDHLAIFAACEAGALGLGFVMMRQSMKE